MLALKLVCVLGLVCLASAHDENELKFSIEAKTNFTES